MARTKNAVDYPKGLSQKRINAKDYECLKPSFLRSRRLFCKMVDII